jgi:hypothetical protein
MADGYFVPGKGWVQEKEPEPSPEYGEPDELLGTPVILFHRGEEKEFFPISSLAAALNRSVVTIRKWEGKGFIPKATFGTPSKALGGRVRLYTRAQIVGLRDIAREEGLLDDLTKAVTKTQFAAMAHILFNGEK